MLVLSRQRDETIMIGDEVEITVVDVRGDKVRIGISAPSSIAVHRKEVYEAIESENARAAGAALEVPSSGVGVRGGGKKLGVGASKLVGGRSSSSPAAGAGSLRLAGGGA